MSANVPVYAVGSPCCHRRYDRGRNVGCRGNLVARAHIEFAPGRYREDPNGDIIILVCPRCGQAHGRAVTDDEGTPRVVDLMATLERSLAEAKARVKPEG